MIDWTPYGKSFQDLEDDDILKPGMLIRVNGEQYLIGDINENGGVCDDCAAVRYSDIVEAYAVVWRAE